MNNEIVCIICPRSCRLVRHEDGSITGYSCLRGKAYGEQEFTLPKRSITSFVRTTDDKIICVKTSNPIDKKLIFPLIDLLKDIHPEGEFEVGDVLIKNVLNTDVDIVVTRGTKLWF